MQEQLNPQQQIAVKHVEGPLLVLAGAGSGKTRIVTFRVAHLLELGVPSNEILAVTFTNKAAEEMRHRIHHLTHQSVMTCTFHSLAARILRESITHLGYARDFVIYDEEDSEKVLKECLIALNMKGEKNLYKQFKSQISQAKNALIEPEQCTEDKVFLEVYTLYQRKLKEYNALDFEDLLFLTVKLFQNAPEILKIYQKRWTFILIDEYQDTNQAQYTIAKLLAQEHQNVFAVGDPDQSIYSWRGANIHNILNFEQDFPGATVIPLEQNYRSRSNILEAANALIQHNASRYKKNLWSDRGEGQRIGLYIAETDHMEAEFVVKQLYKLKMEKNIPLTDCAIFYRTNFQSRIFEDYLLKEKIPYVIVGGISFYQRKEVKDILAYLRMVLSNSDYLAFARTINIPKRGMGESTLEKIKSLAEQNNTPIFEICAKLIHNTLPFKLSTRQLEGLKEYVNLIFSFREMLKTKMPLHELITQLLERSHYLAYLREDPESYEERRGNIEELVTKAREWEEETDAPSLSAFLEELSLKSSADEKSIVTDHVRMMTLHNSKGLEFNAVFLIGMEEELFPHINALGKDDALEEERRLCYVGMTRAKEYLYLSACRNRYLWGMPRIMRPSRFLSEIPEEFLENYYPVRSIAQRDDIVYDASETGFEMGQSVFHKDFGVGIVKKVYNTSLGLTYDVYFPKANTLRSLVAKFAKLSLV